MTKIKATSKVILINEKNELLLLRIGEHTVNPRRSHTWDLPGGFIDDGEAEVDGAIREVREETGIELGRDQLALVYAETAHYEEIDTLMTHLRYVARLDHTPEVTVSWEHESYKWVDFDANLDEYELRPHFVKAIENIKRYL